MPLNNITQLQPFNINSTASYSFANVSAAANVTAGNVKTDNLLYANGVAWTFGSTYSNSNVESYLPTYSGNLSAGNSTLSGNVNLSTATSLNLGNTDHLTITGGSASQILITDGAGNVSWADVPFPATSAFIANSITLTQGVYVSGNIESIQTYGDYLDTNGTYIFTDGTAAGPAWELDVDFLGIAEPFNRIVMNISYTASSGHTIYVQLYNYVTSQWDNFGTYTGLGNYYSFALSVYDSTAYISSNRVQLKLYHNNSGNSSHTTQIDYIGLEQSYQGPQGPKGSTGATGAAGQGVPTGGTTSQVLVKNSDTNYDTEWTSDLSLAGNISVTGKTVLSNVGNITITGGSSNQLLQTDGQGNLSWVTPTGTTITVDNFTGNGVETQYTLTVTPTSEAYTMVAMAGTLQPRSVYSLSGNVITFSSAPPATAPIEITTFSSLMGYGTSDIVANSFTANTLTANTLAGNIISSSTNLSVNTLSANSITNTGTGIPTINSATSINFTASTVVRTTSSPFQFYNCSSTVRDAIAASNGYVIYNTTTNKLQVYANGSWVDLH